MSNRQQARRSAPNGSNGLRAASITMREVARAAKVSLATASRALRREGYVAPATRERVVQAAGRLGYSVNLGARSLRTQQTMVLAHVLPSSYPQPFYSYLCHHLACAAADRGYALTQSATEFDPDVERRHFEKLVRHRVDGVLITNIRDLSNLDVLRSAGMPTCLIERPSDKVSELGGVLVDHLRGVAQAVEHLIGLGHRRIHFLGVWPGASIEAERLQGYRQAMRVSGIEPTDDMIHLADQYSVVNGRLLVQRMLESNGRATAVFAASDLVAIGVLQELYARRVRVPDDISVMNFEDSWGENTVPPLTCIHMPAKELAGEAIDLLIARMTDPAGPPQCRTVRPRLVIRESTRRIA